MANRNVLHNNLQNAIRIIPTMDIDHGPLLPLDLFSIEDLCFCMCNPPFYHDAGEMYRHAKEKAVEPFSVFPCISS